MVSDVKNDSGLLLDRETADRLRSASGTFSCPRICSLHGGEVYQKLVFVGGDFSVVQQMKRDPFSVGLSGKDK